ncbi:peptide deformylase [soil metagenome]
MGKSVANVLRPAWERISGGVDRALSAIRGKSEMASLPIRLYGDAILRQKARLVRPEDIDPEFRGLAEQMGSTMYDNAGLGLAANQIGDLRRIFVADVAQVSGEKQRGKRVKDPEKRSLLVFLNPELLESSHEDDEYEEGCLSIADLDGKVFRPSRVKVRYRDLDWNEKEEWIDGLLARVFQHELDHLDGILFVDRMPEYARTKIAGALNQLKKKNEKAGFLTTPKRAEE